MNTETKVCLECATAGISQQVMPQGRCACCGTVAPVTIEPRRFWETQEQFRARAFEAQRSFEAAVVEAAPIEVEVTKVEKKGRCPHYGQIKEFFSLAREMGFDTTKNSQDRWRGAIGMLLGRRVQSRSELSGAEWAYCTNALRMGKLFI